MPPIAVTTDFGPYGGPLAERQVAGVHPDMSTSYFIVTDTPELRAFEVWLRRNPIYVRAPGEKYLVFGLVAPAWARGEILARGANLLLAPTEQPLGPWEPDGGEKLKWVFAVLDHYALDYDPLRQGWGRTRQELIDWYHRDSVPVDWNAVADRLRSTGRPVPDDLFDDHD